MVRCKFKCESVKDGEVLLGVVSDGSAENKSFFKYTPGGSLRFSTVNETALQQFEEGKEYYVDISRAIPGANPDASQPSVPFPKP